MKLRRAMALAAATAVISPVALLAAPTAFATQGSASSSPSATASRSADASASATTPENESTASASASAPDSDAYAESSSAASASSSPSASPSTSASASTSTSASASASASPTGSAADGDAAFDPYSDCETFDLDEKLTATISGLPNKIVAGSGWHAFRFVVENDSDRDLENVWINAFTEYSDDLDASLYTDLARIQVREDGKWTDAYQETLGGGGDGTVNFSGSFVALLDSLEKGSSATLDLRIQVSSKAPAGSAVALSEAVYAGKGSSCYGNGDSYDVTVLSAGSQAGDVDDAEPSGEKPTTPAQDVKPQGAARPITGNLAETGSSSALPVIGLVGGAAVAAGAGALFLVRRRRSGARA
ncbi:LAETG motif-containing sortase-dependent surface protein [Streptomyces sp. MUM 2J]|uniref:LAETG motif-containing sortase-dependent surface protein n=1 Tax=Streptomyces sp. MUM 2J TaxID=2791987 RepID=UPI001F048F16|nr:LAETG motif-containing sortase-dependent surface protein [Streptomyces sp. MUM 2J]MCH0563980.1 LPXTG cell wall anchor domain-containing protein [Streptomyces sp. MUM 2J]